MNRILEKLFPKLFADIWNAGYEAGLTDGFENASVVAAHNDLFILPEKAKEGKIVSLTGGTA